MEIIITSIIFIVLGTAEYFLLRHQHVKDMETLAADCSARMQEMYQELVVVCTEEGSAEAHEIKLRVRLNVSAEQLLFAGDPAQYKKEGEIVQCEGIMNQLKNKDNV